LRHFLGIKTGKCLPVAFPPPKDSYPTQPGLGAL
jgi:hypothetical protein